MSVRVYLGGGPPLHYSGDDVTVHVGENGTLYVEGWDESGGGKGKAAFVHGHWASYEQVISAGDPKQDPTWKMVGVTTEVTQHGEKQTIEFIKLSKGCDLMRLTLEGSNFDPELSVFGRFEVLFKRVPDLT